MSAVTTQNRIPCCLCGTLILPNAANQCNHCLAQQLDLQHELQQGPKGGPITIFQCRNCRRYQSSPHHYEHADHESPVLLQICLKHIPHLKRFHLVDAGWIWTEPHSMRFKLRLDVRADILNVPVEQRVRVVLHCKFQMCNNCNRQYTNRTWQAKVQIRSRGGSGGGNTATLARLESVLARAKELRRHITKLDVTKHGFDLYFLHVRQAQAVVQFLHHHFPFQSTTTTKLVSADVKSNTANLQHTILCDLVPLVKDTLVVLGRTATGIALAGHVGLLVRVSNRLELVDTGRSAAAAQCNSNCRVVVHTISVESYYKNEKHFEALRYPLTRFVVLDVEVLVRGQQDDDSTMTQRIYQGPRAAASGDGAPTKFALAEVVVVRESDLGVNDQSFCVTSHLGHLIAPGDVVLGYDLEHVDAAELVTSETDPFLSSMSAIASPLHHHFVLPDVVLVRKVRGKGDDPAVDDGDDGAKRKSSKRKDRRQKRQEGRKKKELEEHAQRMGLLDNDDEQDDASLDAALESAMVALELDMGDLGADPQQEEDQAAAEPSG